MAKKVKPENLLHRHPQKEQDLEIGLAHVIVDKTEWLQARGILQNLKVIESYGVKSKVITTIDARDLQKELKKFLKDQPISFNILGMVQSPFQYQFNTRGPRGTSTTIHSTALTIIYST